MDMKEDLKSSCIELYGFPDDTNKNEIITFFQGSVLEAIHVDARCKEENEPVWILLCVNSMVAQGFYQQQNVSYKDHHLTVRPCSVTDNIPQTWTSLLQNNLGMAKNDHETLDTSNQSKDTAVSFPQNQMHYPFQLIQHPNFPPQHHAPYPCYQFLYPGGNVVQHTPAIHPHQAQMQHMFPYPQMGQYIQYPFGMQHTGNPYTMQRMTSPWQPQTEPHPQQVQIKEKEKIDATERGEVNSSNRIVVTKLPRNVTEERLKSFFKSRRSSGGGKINSLEIKEDQAILTFRDSAVVERVLQKTPLLFEDKQIHVKKYFSDSDSDESSEDDNTDDDESDDDKEECSCTIEVRGMTDKTTPDTVEMYFESKRAGGGAALDIVKFEFDEEEKFARVTYKTEEDMRKVLIRQHKIDGALMQMKEHIPPKPRPLYDNKVILKGVNPNTSKDGLMNFLEAKANATPTDLTYGEEEGIVLVSYEETPDFQKLEQACQKRKMDGNILKVSRVPISNCVMVTGIAPTTRSGTLQYYFENPRSGGGNIEKIVHSLRDDKCLVYFEDHKVAEIVCQKKHTIDSQQLSIKMYLPMLGETTDDGPSLKIPESMTISTIDERILIFLLSSTKIQEALQMQLQDLHAHIVWPDTRTSPLKVECILTKQVKNCRKLAKSWRKDVLSNVQQFVQQISVKRIPVLQNAWDQTMQCLQEKTIKNPDGVEVVVERVTWEVFVVGYTDFAQELANEITLDIKRIEEELERQKQRITENVTIKHYQLLLICKKNFIEDTQSKYTGMKVRTDLKKRQVTFEGSTVDVLKAKLEMLELTSTIVSSEAGHFSKLSLQLLDHSKTKAYISQKMKDDSIEAVWETEKGTMTVYAMTDKDAVKATHILKKSILESKIPVKKESQQPLFSDLWDSHVEDIKVQRAQYPVEIEWNPTDGNITVCCVDEDKCLVLELVQDFLEANTIVESKLQLRPGMLKFLQQSDRQSKIQKIAKEMKQDHVKIEMSKIEIIIKGTSVGLQKSTQRVNALIQKIQNKKHTLEKPGITKLMESNAGQSKLARVERMMHVSIVPGDMEDSDNGQTAQRGELVQEIARCERKKYSVMVMLGDVTELETDMLINSSNEALWHSGGLAKAIVNKGGLQIQHDCDGHILRNRKEMSAGDIYHGRPGNLKCKMVSHAVCPLWQGGNKNEEYVLADIVLECLEEGTRHHYESIAIPALGTGAFRIPIKDATRIIIKAVEEFFSDDKVDSSIKKVYLCDVKRETVDTFTEELISVYGQRKVQLVSNSADSQNWSTRNVKSRQPTRQRSQVENGSTMNVKSKREVEVVTLDVGQLQVKIYQGDITLAEVDALVNSTNRDFDLSRGAVSKAIKTQGGKDLEQQLTLKRKEMRNKGIAVTTSGGALPCKFVIHLNVEERTKSDWKEKIQMALTAAEKSGIKSLAFPAFGKDLQWGPTIKDAAKYFFDAVMEFQSSTIEDLKEVHIVIFKENMLHEFMIKTQACFRGYKSTKPKRYIEGFSNYMKGINKEEGLAWNPKYNKIPMAPPSYPVTIYGDNDDDIERAIAKLEESLTDDKFRHREFRDNVIQQFSKTQGDIVKGLATTFEIEVKFEKRLGRIQLFGLQENISDASDKIHTLIRKAEKDRQAALEAELIADMVTWSFVEDTATGSELIAYPPVINRRLEKAYRNQENTVEFYDSNGVTYVVNLNTLEESYKNNPGDIVKVVRKIKSEDMADAQSQLPMGKISRINCAQTLKPKKTDNQLPTAKISRLHCAQIPKSKDQ